MDLGSWGLVEKGSETQSVIQSNYFLEYIAG